MQMTLSESERRIAQALLVLRLTLAIFLFQWGMEKFLHPEYTQGIGKAFYGIEIGNSLAYGIGTVQLIIVACLVLGLFKRIAYGAVTLMHGITVLVSYKQLLDPYGVASGKPYYHLFVASVPVLGAFILLYMLRGYDRYSLNLTKGT